MIRNTLLRRCALLLTVLIGTRAGAQVPLPTPPLVTPEVRARLRAVILQTTRMRDVYGSGSAPDLALPLAQLGYWDQALRMCRNDINAPHHSDELWQWRAYQMARVGRWLDVSGAASHIKRADLQADCLLHGAKVAEDSGVMLHDPLANSAQLLTLLQRASALLRQEGSFGQRAFCAYLWASGGDYLTARAMFEDVYREATKFDAGPHGRFDFEPKGAARGVLLTEAKAGMLSSALRHAAAADDFLLGWWIAAARTSSDLYELLEIVHRLPPNRQVANLYEISAKFAWDANKPQGLRCFHEAELLHSNAAPAAAVPLREEYLDAMTASEAAAYLDEPELEAEAFSELSRDAMKSRPDDTLRDPGAVLVFPDFDLEGHRQYGYSSSRLTPARLDKILEDLVKAPPSEVKFQLLETLATESYLRNRATQLLATAKEMMSVAQRLALQGDSGARKPAALFNPYWPTPPHALESIFWLQRAGDSITPAVYAQKFAHGVGTHEAPFAAMTLIQLGFPALADNVFDPANQISKIVEAERIAWKAKHQPDWSLFNLWPNFAAMEARYRSPEAPFRWFSKLKDGGMRTQVLRAWVGTLFPPRAESAPYVEVASTGSTSAY